MFNIIPLILILLSLGTIIIVVVRKFSVLANLDVDTIQAEREIKFKEQIIGTRIKRNYFRYYSRLVKIIKPGGEKITGLFKWLYKKLIELKDNYNKEAELDSDTNKEALVDKITLEAEELSEKHEFEEAEKKFIEAISIEAKNMRAFRGLGKMYFERKDFNEAKQTYEHVLKLLENDYELFPAEPKEGEPMNQEKEDTESIIAQVYHDLTLTLKAMESNVLALEVIKKALKLEPNNPRYLDTLFEISIINKDKINALEAYQKLREVNPENQKLSELKEQLDEL